MKSQLKVVLFLLFSVFFLSSSNVNFAGADELFTPKNKENPFTPKASLMRYWNNQITTKLPISPFLLSKASPLSSVDSALFANLAAQNALSTHLPAFCSSAKLLCFPDLSLNLAKHDKDTNFASYEDKNFTNYGTDKSGGVDSFRNYSKSIDEPLGLFRRYSRNSVDHGEKFSQYSPATNVVVDNFISYGTGGTRGEGEFKAYHEGVNADNLLFKSYSDGANGRAQTFSNYQNDTNVGIEWFISYGKKGNEAINEFVIYDKGTNLYESNFTNYGENGNKGNDTFKSYGFEGNQPRNYFTNYGDGSKAGTTSFSNYGENSSVATDAFKSYAKNSNADKVNFASYGQFSEDNFTGYGQGAQGKVIGFKRYGQVVTFKDYAKEGATFAKYNVSSATTTTMARDNLAVKKWVEPGKFFRESMLKKGTVMAMPDIRDKLPKRPFLPRSITSKLPFSTAKIAQLKEIFHAADSSAMKKIIFDAINECERAPSPGETKRCVGSAEDLIDFASSVLGRNAVVWTTQNVNGAKKDIEIGSVKGINGGKVTKSVSCHQSLYPYLVYYCHSVPKVRVYEADILDPNSKAKINHGVAICHLDTSSWSPTHGAFLALGSGPGQIEVCHWIFENDMTWTTADD